MIAFWMLVFLPPGAHPFDGGAYQTKAACEAAAIMQLEYWRQDYGPRLQWRCRYVPVQP